MRPFLAVVVFLVVFSIVAVGQSPPTHAPDVETNWESIDQLCGQLELSAPKQKHYIVDGKSEIRLYTAFLEDATLTLYHGTSTERECCAVKEIATTQSHRFGAFEFEGVQPGTYWLRVQKNEFVRVIPVRVTDNFDARQCKKPWINRAFVVDSNPPKVHVGIR